MAGEMIVQFEGTTGKEPELGQKHDGAAALTVSVAVTPRVKRDGEWCDGTTSWIDCRIFDQLAENVAASLPKGTRVIVTGRLSEREYTRKDGTQGRSLQCDVDTIGPSLKFATAQVAKRDRGSSVSAGQSAGSSWSQPPQDSWAQPVREETPF